MKPKLILCLALVLSGGLFGCSTTDRHRPDTNSLKVVVKPEKTQVHVGEHFNLALRVENPATTNQYVRVMSCCWWQQWQPSNPSIFFDTEGCTWNAPMSLKIPAGGAITFDLKVSVSELVSRKFSFQMGFTPIGSKETFWSDDVSIGVAAQLAATKDPTKQIAEILTECQKIKPEMTRAELLKVFTTEGGLSTAAWRTFVYRGCPYIKVDVDFTPSDPKQKMVEERPTDTISKISKPYLDWSIGD
jgi:hypothetical protein